MSIDRIDTTPEKKGVGPAVLIEEEKAEIKKANHNSSFFSSTQTAPMNMVTPLQESISNGFVGFGM